MSPNHTQPVQVLPADGRVPAVEVLRYRQHTVYTARFRGGGTGSDKFRVIPHTSQRTLFGILIAHHKTSGRKYSLTKLQHVVFRGQAVGLK